MASQLRRRSALPQDVIADIFTKLPVKSLTRFQSLSKAWSSHFKTPNFISDHLRQSTQKNPSLILGRLLWDSRKIGIFDLALFALVRKSMDIEFRLPTFSAIVGVSHGLICIIRTYPTVKILICNPATGKIRRVPWRCFQVIEFCFNPSDNDFKVVVLQAFENTRIDVEVYSLRTGSWKTVGGFDLDGVYADFAHRCVTVNGSSFWLTEGSGFENCKHWVVSYDLNREKLRKIVKPSPVNYGNGNRVFPKLAIYKDSVAMLIHQEIESVDYCIELWILNDTFDGKESWNKVNTIGPFSPLESLVGIWKNEILMAKGEEMYGLEGGLKARLPADHKARYTYDVFTYAESLVPVLGTENEVELDAQSNVLDSENVVEEEVQWPHGGSWDYFLREDNEVEEEAQWPKSYENYEGSLIDLMSEDEVEEQGSLEDLLGDDEVEEEVQWFESDDNEISSFCNELMKEMEAEKLKKAQSSNENNKFDMVRGNKFEEGGPSNGKNVGLLFHEMLRKEETEKRKKAQSNENNVVGSWDDADMLDGDSGRVSAYKGPHMARFLTKIYIEE